ncbi:hypothetical protein KDL01_11135 [Actinospica durhamensis]|uniref:HNH endonuclease n=1 Tax=Actinospica durhamensis TaxID=1508375 RepID=A0A941ENV4_9ACTN|nr:hypothetical protein [Actinospica durhamensis]MBR7833823.1 hypothetical protein [Actinospica durhamensis]
MEADQLPSWRDESLSTVKRAALWLVAEVGEGSVFTKAQLRDAFPDIAQIDRRMRDLRDYGWQIDTRREDPHLEAHEQRFTQAGDPVWAPGTAKRQRTGSVSAVQRREVFLRDDYICRSCGIAAGARYSDDSYESAQLDIARRIVVKPGGEESVELVAECNRCRVGGRALVADLGKLLAGIDSLGALERRVFVGWIKADKRELALIERLWGEYRSLPAESRDAVRETLRSDS